MMRTLLVRGMTAGLVAGVLATVFAYLAGEPPVTVAIGFEESTAHEHGPELVSRSIQSTLGLFTGVAVYGIAIGGLLALTFAFAYGRVGTLRPRSTALLTTAAAFTVVVLVPFLKYPANPPAVGREGTIQDRTGLYFAFVALSIVAGIAATVLGRRLADRKGAWVGGISACLGYLVVVAVCAWLLPIVDEVPGDFPADTLWTFRVSSLGTHLTLWTVFGLVFATLADRAFTRSAAPRAVPTG
ncbi:CbtA family protein [Amycolatopsis alkalitolerans]|uniref:CbtA family protein n=1 Tax=Amycolatopsis alkalitolerans TaxID=2547244 RepID=A0A5C4M020_9PSEU|nr:CbtA family protein [Amycolatopsis alkalitolerans]TNC24550.1 CbtA family protein [Amycolatopsis alkalitolerans]